MAASATGEVLAASLERKVVTTTTLFTVHLVTGDIKNAGTDAKIWFRLYDAKGNKTSDICADNRLGDIKPASIFSIQLKDSVLPKDFGDIVKVDIWRNDFGLAPDWFLDVIKVANNRTGQLFVFTAQRWIKGDRHVCTLCHESRLPQADDRKDRLIELETRRRDYRYAVRTVGFPVQVLELPDEERFSDPYQFDIKFRALQLLKSSGLIKFLPPLNMKQRWESVDEVKECYKFHIGTPIGSLPGHWDNDIWFGLQRLQGVNPFLISRCKYISDKLAVDIKRLEKIIGTDLETALLDHRVFIIDLEIMEDLPCKDGYKMCAPIALFYLDEKKQLLPLAIQLHQRPDDENPVFYKDDPAHVWQTAKMWYNLADANYHQSVSHLGFTHVMMEGFAVSAHRNLSVDHPVLKLLAPHFLYLMAINQFAVETLINPGGWVDKTMNIGVAGLSELVCRGSQNWRLDIHANPITELGMRGVLDPKDLPYYPFRDDAVAIYNTIFTYVKTIVDYFYDTPDKIEKDTELQNWAKELVRAKSRGGCGYKGIPGDGRFTDKNQIITTVAGIIYTCSVVHAAANFGQFDEYGFPPNYPLCLEGDFPTKKELIKDLDVVKMLPSRDSTLNAMVVTSILSEKGTQSLGTFEVQYMFDPIGLAAAEALRAELKTISENIKKRNANLTYKYTYLDPENVPNAISI